MRCELEGSGRPRYLRHDLPADEKYLSQPRTGNARIDFLDDDPRNESKEHSTEWRKH